MRVYFYLCTAVLYRIQDATLRRVATSLLTFRKIVLPSFPEVKWIFPLVHLTLENKGNMVYPNVKNNSFNNVQKSTQCLQNKGRQGISPFFWATTQRVVVIPYRCFGTTHRSHCLTGFSNLEDVADRLSRNVRKELPLLAV